MYIKAKINEDITINVEFYSDSIYSTCPVCGIEVNVDPEIFANIVTEDSIEGTAVYCDPCGETYRTNEKDKLLTAN